VVRLGVDDLVRGGLGQPDRLVHTVVDLVNLIDLVTNVTDLSVDWWTWST
jgi:hypothetical protein